MQNPKAVYIPPMEFSDGVFDSIVFDPENDVLANNFTCFPGEILRVQ